MYLKMQAQNGTEFKIKSNSDNNEKLEPFNRDLFKKLRNKFKV